MNFNISKQDDLFEDSWWLYEEVYKVNDKYEFRVLLLNRTKGLIDFIISAEQIFFKSNKKSHYKLPDIKRIAFLLVHIELTVCLVEDHRAT